jgi:hypothetical protein
MIYMVNDILVTASVIQWPEFLAANREVRVRFPSIPDFLTAS